MNNTFSPEYAKLQADFHQQRPDYGCSGHKYADPIMQLARNLNTRDILDYGCGKCTLQKSIPFPIQNYDPFIIEHAGRPLPADLVVCTDVMEHVEEDFLQNVIQDIHALTKRAAFFQIATTPAKKTLPDGRNAHITLHDSNWWLAALLPFFTVNAMQNMNGGFIMVCEPIRSQQS